jgi:hypothetical protein
MCEGGLVRGFRCQVFGCKFQGFGSIFLALGFMFWILCCGVHDLGRQSA